MGHKIDVKLGKNNETLQELVQRQSEVNERLVLAVLRADERCDALEQREQMLVETAVLRERFMGMVAHDLRTPVAAISMSAHLLLRRGSLMRDDIPVVERVGLSSRRIDAMIEQLYDFARARLGEGLPLRRIPSSNLGDVCQGVCAEVAIGRSASVHCSVEGDVTGTWDRERLAEVIANLAGNAVEHARDGTSVAVHAFGNGPEVVVTISNEGSPIAPDVLPYIFEPFRRGDGLQHAKRGNLGLGLYIAREITRAHDGVLEVRSAEGVTTFTLRLPRESAFGDAKRLSPADPRRLGEPT